MNQFSTFEEIKQLVNDTENINNLNNFDNQSMLHLAVYYQNDLEIVQYLVEHGADVNVLNNSGVNPLYLATHKYRTKECIIDYLIEKGSNVNIKNKHGVSTLMLAAKTFSLSCIEKLIQHGADIYYHSPDGISPVDIAIQHERLDVAFFITNLKFKLLD